MSSKKTSKKSSRRSTRKSEPKKLPVYGPLDVASTSEFYKDSKQRFLENYNRVFSNVVRLSDFELLNTLGKGGFGLVKLARKKKTKAYFAVKAIRKRQLVESNAVSHALNEKKMLQSVDFPFGVRLECFSQDRSYLYLFMPFISGGEMYTFLRKSRRFTESWSCFYAAQVVLALEYFQHIRIVHRDIKPENILLDHNGFIKVVDFGFAKLVETRTYTFCGTPQYIAPEMIQGIGYAASVDWWALGILIFEMTVGRPPFRGIENTTLFTQILYQNIRIPYVFSESLQNLLRKLLQRDVTRRLGILRNGADDVKGHAWFKDIDWLQLFNRQTTPPYVPKVEGDSDCTNFPYSWKQSSLVFRESDDFAELFEDF